MEPRVAFAGLAPNPSSMLLSVSMTSSTRPAETWARGSRMKTMLSSTKAMMTCIA